LPDKIDPIWWKRTCISFWS